MGRFFMFFGDQNKYLILYYAVSDVECNDGMDDALYQGNGDNQRAHNPRNGTPGKGD